MHDGQISVWFLPTWFPLSGTHEGVRQMPHGFSQLVPPSGKALQAQPRPLKPDDALAVAVAALAGHGFTFFPLDSDNHRLSGHHDVLVHRGHVESPMSRMYMHSTQAIALASGTPLSFTFVHSCR